MKTRIVLFLFFILIASNALAKKDNLEVIDSLILRLNEPFIPDTTKIGIYSEIALLYYNVRSDKAIEYANEGKQIAEKIGSKQDIADFLNVLGLSYIAQNNTGKALDYFLRSWNINDELNSEQGKLTNYSNIGYAYYLLNSYDKSESYLQKSLQLAQKNTTPFLITILANIGSVKNKIGQLDSAEYYLSQGLTLVDKDKIPHIYAHLLANLGDNYRCKGQFDKSLDNLNQALNIFSELHNNFGLIKTNYMLGLLYLAIKKDKDNISNIEKRTYDRKAISCFFEAEKYSKQGIDNRMLIEIFKNLADIYQGIGDLDLSNQYLKKAIDLKDSLFSIGNYNQIATIEDNMVKEQFEKRQSKLEKEKLIVIMSAILLSVIIFILSSFLYKIRKKNTIIEMHSSEIESLNNNLQQREVELLEINHTKDKLFSIISHDLKSPVSSLYQLLSSNNTKNNDNQSDRYRSSIKQITLNIMTLLENLLNWSRLQLNGINLYFDEFNVRKLGDECVNICLDVASNKNIQIKNLIDPNIILVADREAIGLTLRNILINSIKFSYSNSQIELFSEINNGVIAIIVRDYGVGISEEAKNNIFELTDKVTTSGTNNEKGTGLGLVIANEIMNKHFGELLIHNNNDKGTTVKLVFNNIDDGNDD